MSRIPYLSNELSPWPSIRIGEPPNATAVIRQTTTPRLYRGSSQPSDVNRNSARLWARASSEANRRPAEPQIQERRTSFGSIEESNNVYESVPMQRLDYKVTKHKVQELLKLRNQNLKQAKRKGDEVEVFRLKNLNLFDNIETPQPHGLEEDQIAENFIGQIDIPRPKSVNQGHTATLCWHLKLEYMQGLTVPDEFSQCTIHPTPTPCTSSTPGSTTQLTSPSSPNPGPSDSSCHTTISSVGSSTLRERSRPSSLSTSSSTIIASELPSLRKQPSTTSISNEEDPFLYIAKYIKKRARGDNSVIRKANQPRPQISNTGAHPSLNTSCTCANHNCLTYLSGPPSQHCRFCKTPRPHPEIAAAIRRIAEATPTVPAHALNATSFEAKEPCDEYQLREDVRLVVMYNAEMEKRCRKGVWWEGWLVVEDLKKT